MKKILYLHGFLGSPEDMNPLFLDGFDCEAYNLRDLLEASDPVQKLAFDTSAYAAIVGYSFGGRILEELKSFVPDKSHKWIFCSSRHSPYSEEELLQREVFRKALKAKAQESVDVFYKDWESLSLFTGHSMKTYRDEYKISYEKWAETEICQYLEKFFNSPQVEPLKDVGVHYFYGDLDSKYSLEAQRLKPYFNVESFSNCGHRAIFEDVAEFKKKLKRILEL